MGAAYRIPDEPRPGGLAPYTVSPTWPLLAMMLGGSWIGLPWFVVNGAAMGSPALRREVIVAALTPVLAVVLAFVSFFWIDDFGLPKRAVAYAFVAITAVKLAAAYWLYTSQLRSFGIYEHFGGQVRQGAPVAILAAVARSYVVNAAFQSSVWLGIVVM
jgi:hypothetical protein